MTFPGDYQHQAGVFAMLRARKLAKDMENVCGSPLEVLFLCMFVESAWQIGEKTVIVNGEGDIPDEAKGGIYVRPQFQIGDHRVDFLIGCGASQPVIVECDGQQYHYVRREQIERDRARDANLVEKGYRVFRYPGTQIFNEGWYVAAEVFAEVNSDAFERWGRIYQEFSR